MDERLCREVRHITTRLGAIVCEQAGETTLAHFEQLRHLAKTIRARHNRSSNRTKRRLLAQLTVEEAYQLLHTCSLFFRAHPATVQSLPHLFQELRAAGVTPDALQRCLNALGIQPVLTAPPTEAKRRTMLNHLRRLTVHCDQTGEIRERCITPLEEADKTLFFLEHTILPPQQVSMRPSTPNSVSLIPPSWTAFLTFGSWVAVARDGHPFVTPASQSCHRHQARRMTWRSLCQ